LFNGQYKKVLHIAPEAVFEKLFKTKLGQGYLTADLFDPKAMVRMDITNIQYPDKSFDVIYCSHVLEHVPDDRLAMRELLRVLKDDGWAILLVPIVTDVTFEDPSITDPLEREKIFGQADHVRNYGNDYKQRLRESGFFVEVIYPQDFLTENEIVRMGITKAAGEIYLCTRP
jgi:SAM-dependent methyltransferase